MRVLLPSLASLLLTAAVAQVCATVSNAVAGAEGIAADALVPPDKEKELGRQLSAQVEKESKLVADPAVQRYIAGLGADIASAAAKNLPEGIKLTFKVIDDDATVNAFALPGGNIYVYTGLLKLASNESEVVCVLAHEAAHVTERHVAERLVASQGLDAVLAMALGQKPGLVGQLAQSVVGQGTLIQFTRSQEADADAKGLPYAVRAGYSPEGFVTFFDKLKKDEGAKWMKWLQDHPLPSERITAAKQRIAKLKGAPDKLGTEEYVRFKAKL